MKWNMACTGTARGGILRVVRPARGIGPDFCPSVFLADPAELRAMELGVFAFVMELEARDVARASVE